jgi:YfiH family protein
LIRVEQPLAGGERLVIRFTEVDDGDLRVDAPGVEQRRAAIDPRPWTWLHQRHGRDVVVVGRPGGGAGEEADAAVTRCRDAVLAVQVADCAPVALWSPDGVVGAVHAGWRGLVGGVLPAAAEAMRALGAGPISAVLGPCIRVERYEFGADDLAEVVAALGDSVIGRTRSGQPALDMVAAVRSSLDLAGIGDLTDVGRCTAEAPDLWSWRADASRCRQSVVVVKEAAGP